MSQITRMIFACLLLFHPLLVNAQRYDDIDPILIRLRGKIVSADDGLPVPYAHVVNMRTRGGTTTDVNGRFSMQMLNVDSLAISAMGFMQEYYHVPIRHNEDSLLIIWAKPVRYAIGEVKIKGERTEVNMDGIPAGKPVDIDPELRGDAFNSKPPLLAALFSPISFWQYHLSRREKEKREVRSAIVSEERWEALSSYYNKGKVMALTGLNEEQADTFMIYFNSKGVLNYTATEYDVRMAILEQYQQYQQEKR